MIGQKVNIPAFTRLNDDAYNLIPDVFGALHGFS